MRLLLYLLISLSLSSCARKFLVQEAYVVESERVMDKNRVDLRTYYAGDAFDYITFQIEIDNRSEDTIYLSQRDVELKLDSRGSRGTIIRPIRKRDLIANLVSEERAVDADKKASMATNLILSGANILSGVLAGGGVASTVVYGTGSAADIIEQRRQYNIIQGTIEEQIAYLEEYTLDEAAIKPGGNGSYDLHFERLMIDSDCQLIIYCEGQEYITEYELVVEERRPE